MTAATQDVKSDQYGTPTEVYPTLLTADVEANTTIYAGTMVGLNAAGNAVPGYGSTAYKLIGLCERQVVQGSTAGSVNPPLLVKPGVFEFSVGTGADAVTKANRFANVYAIDDNTVGLTSAGGTRTFAGFLVDLNTVNSKARVAVGIANPLTGNTEAVPNPLTAFRARAVLTSVATYTYAAGVITAASNGAIGAQDGVTLVAGDQVVLPTGVAATASDAGLYVVTNPGGASAKFVLTRADWWADAAVINNAQSIRVGGEGTAYKNTNWRILAAASTITVGTTDPKLYPESFSGQTALVAGTFTISGPVFSAKTSVDLCRVTANTCTLTTGGYCATSAGATGITAGGVGTGAIVVQACVAAGTINNADISTLNWTVTNQA